LRTYIHHQLSAFLSAWHALSKRLRKSSMVKRFLIVIGVMSILVWVTYVGLGHPSLGTDDAHIFFVYGKNISAGEGVVYNPGGERVEGFSSPLWTLIVTGCFALSNNPEVWLLLVSVLMVSGAIAVVWRFVDNSDKFTLRGLLFLAWTFSSPSYVIWVSLTLMDTAVWSSLILVGSIVALSANSPRRLALVVSLILLTRPEGMLWALVLISVSALKIAIRRGIGSAWRASRLPLASYGIVLGSMLFVRMMYFGYPLPNTYYAKMSPDILWNLKEGARYLATFVFFNWHILIIGLWPPIAGVLLNLPWVVRSSKKLSVDGINETRLSYVAVSLIGIAVLFTPVVVGGDHFDLSRFYQTLWPLFIIFTLSMVKTFSVQISSGARYMLVSLAILAFLVVPKVNWLNQQYGEYIRHEFTHAENGEIVGATLNAMFDDDFPSVGVILAGGIGLEYNGNVIDVMGLNNLEMAHTPGDRQGKKNHAAFNPDVFLSQLPDLFNPMTGAKGTLYENSLEEHCLRNEWLKGILDDDKFLSLYQPAIISDGELHILAYFERSFLVRMDQQSDEVELLTYPECVIVRDG